LSIAKYEYRNKNKFSGEILPRVSIRNLRLTGRKEFAVASRILGRPWYSWRHQLAALAEAGFRVVAPDMRGYGRTARPEAID
jgi:hypothetical protein